MVDPQHRHLSKPEEFRGFDPAVAGNNLVFLVDHDRNDEAEALDALREPVDLLRRMRARVGLAGDQPRQRNTFDLPVGGLRQTARLAGRVLRLGMLPIDALKKAHQRCPPPAGGFVTSSIHYRLTSILCRDPQQYRGLGDSRRFFVARNPEARHGAPFHGSVWTLLLGRRKIRSPSQRGDRGPAG